MMTKKILSFCLYGNKSIFSNGLISNCKLAKKLFPDWKVRIYCSSNVNTQTINKFKEFDNVEIILVEHNNNVSYMMLRFLPFFDETVEYFYSCDADSRISLRQKKMIDEWIISKKAVHIIRDHSSHNAVILGGLFGVYNPRFREILKEKNINFSMECNKGNHRFLDQVFLGNNVWTIVAQKDHLAHDLYLHYKTGNEISMPLENGEYFCGSCFDENDNYIEWTEKSYIEADQKLIIFEHDIQKSFTDELKIMLHFKIMYPEWRIKYLYTQQQNLKNYHFTHLTTNDIEAVPFDILYKSFDGHYRKLYYIMDADVKYFIINPYEIYDKNININKLVEKYQDKTFIYTSSEITNFEKQKEIINSIKKKKNEDNKKSTGGLIIKTDILKKVADKPQENNDEWLETFDQKFIDNYNPFMLINVLEYRKNTFNKGKDFNIYTLNNLFNQQNINNNRKDNPYRFLINYSFNNEIPIEAINLDNEEKDNVISLKDKKISAVVFSRNDNFILDYKERCSVFFRNLLQSFDEVVYLDWGSENGVSLLDLLKKEECSSDIPWDNIKHIIVPIDTVKQIRPENAEPCTQVLAHNIAHRYTTGDYILHTNIDIIVPSREKLNQIKIYPNTFYNISRRDIEYQLVYSINKFAPNDVYNVVNDYYNKYNTDTLYSIKNNNELNIDVSKLINRDPIVYFGEYCNQTMSNNPQLVEAYNKYAKVINCGDFQFGPREIWEDIRGFEEEMTKGYGYDTNIQGKVIKHGYNIIVLTEPKVFHIQHGPRSVHNLNKSGNAGDKMNDFNKFVLNCQKTENKETWGFYENGKTTINISTSF